MGKEYKTEREKEAMITLKDLKNRVYSGKECVRFEYNIQIDKEHEILATFKKQRNIDSTEWNMQIVTNRTRDKDSEVYNFGYVMPRDNLPLELIAATGIKYFQLYIKEEIQIKSNLDFELGNILQGM